MHSLCLILFVLLRMQLKSTWRNGRYSFQSIVALKTYFVFLKEFPRNVTQLHIIPNKRYTITHNQNASKTHSAMLLSYLKTNVQPRCGTRQRQVQKSKVSCAPYLPPWPDFRTDKQNCYNFTGLFIFPRRRKKKIRRHFVSYPFQFVVHFTLAHLKHDFLTFSYAPNLPSQSPSCVP